MEIIDITLEITKDILEKTSLTNDVFKSGHIGTHFDVMNKSFPLEYSERNSYIFDVSALDHKEIELEDIDPSKIEKGMFIGFYTNFIEEKSYISKEYHSEQPYLSKDLLDYLVKSQISLIGIDFPGVRKSVEHTPSDQYLADHNIFVVENLCNLKNICNKNNLIIRTFPLNFKDFSGLPCRVLAYLN